MPCQPAAEWERPGQGRQSGKGVPTKAPALNSISDRGSLSHSAWTERHAMTIGGLSFEAQSDEPRAAEICDMFRCTQAGRSSF